MLSGEKMRVYVTALPHKKTKTQTAACRICTILKQHISEITNPINTRFETRGLRLWSTVTK